MRIWVTIALLFIMPLVLPADMLTKQYQLASGITVHIATADKADFREARRILQELYGVVQRACRTNTDLLPRYDIYLQKSIRKKVRIVQGKGKTCKIYLSASLKAWRTDYNIWLRLLKIFLGHQLDIAPEMTKIRKLPDWVASALLEKARLKLTRRQLPGPKIYIGAHAMMMRGKYPSIWAIIEYPLLPKYGPAFDLYAELSELLWNSVMQLGRNSRKIVRQMLKESVYNTKLTQKKIFMNTAGSLIISNGLSKIPDYYQNIDKTRELDDIQRWFRYAFRKRAVNIYMPGNANFAETELQMVLKVRYHQQVEAKGNKGNKGTTDATAGPLVVCPLADIPSKWDKIADRQRFLLLVQQRFSLFKFELPQLFYTSINKIIDGIGELNDNDFDNFTTLLNEGLDEFKKALKKQRQLELYLAEIERNKLSFGNSFGYRSRVYKESLKRERNFWPKLSKYLDKIEKEFGY